METDTSVALEQEVMRRTEDGFNRRMYNMSSKVQNKKVRNLTAADRIADYIMKRDSETDKKMV